MTIVDLQKANIEAMKNKDNDARSVLSVIISRYKLMEVEARTTNKTIGEAELLSLLQKVLKELADEKDGYIKVNNQARVDSITKQEETVKKYLPSQLSEDDIRAEINKLDDKSMPSIMKHFKTNFAGKVDMSLVSSIARSL